jgi:predicted amidophosphoribosyltransferase
MKDSLLDLLYPRECAGCGTRILEAGQLAFCPGCDGHLEWIAPPSCPRCGAGLTGERCGECEGRDFRFAGATALGKYDGRLRDFLLVLKFRGGRYLADGFGRRLSKRLDRKFDLVVPVPMSRWKLLFRGYNAAALVEERLARHAGLPFDAQALRKIRRTKAPGRAGAGGAAGESERGLPRVGRPRIGPPGRRRPHHRRDGERVHGDAARGGGGGGPGRGGGAMRKNSE